jgi:hypothetical protein
MRKIFPPVLPYLIFDVRREIPSHFVFVYKNANWSRFRQVLDSRLGLDFSLDRIERESEIDSREKAEAIAAKFSRTHENASQPLLNATVEDSCSVLHNNGFNFNLSALTTPREGKKIIKKLNNGKAPGFDGVPNIFQKNHPRRVAVYLNYVFNSCIKLCYFPNIWKHASVIPILKPGKDHSNPSNSELPISLLSSVSLIFERSFSNV